MDDLVGAEVGVDDARIVLYLLRRAFGDQLAEVENRDAVAATHDSAHVVLDQHDGRGLRANPLDGRDHRGGLAGVHAGQRLVEQKQRRSSRQRERDTERPAVTMRQVLGVLVGEFAQAHELDDLVHGHRPRCLAATHAPVAQAAVSARAHQDVLKHRHFHEQLGLLEGTHQAVPRDAVQGPARDVGAVVDDAPGARRQDAADDVEEGGLAGAVGPDQTENLTWLDGEVDAAERRKAAEVLANS